MTEGGIRGIWQGLFPGRLTAICAGATGCLLAAFAATARAEPAPGREEHAFMVGHQAYRTLYAANGNTMAERNLRARYGTIPFDLPSAASCMTDPAVAPEHGLLDWSRIRSLEALEVCAARVLNRFADPAAAADWLTRQGFTMTSLQVPNHCGGESRWFSWQPGQAPGPDALWQAQSWPTRWGHLGIEVTVDACRDADSPRSIDTPGQSPPFFSVFPGLTGRFQK